MKKNVLKSVMTLIITITLALAFGFVVWRFCNEDMAGQIVSAFLTIATSVIGFYIGYQSNKVNNNQDKEK